MDRHDLAYLRDSVTLHFLDVSLPETVKQKVYQLLNGKRDKHCKFLRFISKTTNSPQ